MQFHRITLHCPAKINLGLEVLERDSASGYHRISTIMQAIDLYDRLELEILNPEGLSGGAASGAEPPELDIKGPFGYEVPVEGNSVLSAWALMGGSQCFPPLRIRLHKNIPCGAGLGGGSSDAAGMLLALRELARLIGADARLLGAEAADWPLSLENRNSQPRRLELLAQAATLSDLELQALAARIGSDVPFFLGPPCALAEGFGEQLSALDRRLDFALLLVVPRFGSATGQAYAALERDTARREPVVTPWLAQLLQTPPLEAKNMPGELPRRLSNSFGPLLHAEDPVYAELEAFFAAAPALAASLTGSGSGFFALFTDADHAREICAQLAQKDLDLRYLGVHLPIKG